MRVVHVDDMVDLNPFEGASNRTAVTVILKGRETRYPVPYTVWRKKKRARFTYDSTLDEVKAATTTDGLYAVPVDLDDPTSPWLTASKPALAAVRKVLGRSDCTAHEGVNTGGANGVYWVRILSTRPDGLVVVENITEGAKREVPKVTAVIEPDLLYPLLRGRDVRRWHAEPSAHILLTHKPGMRLNAIPEEEMERSYPHTWEYLKRFEPILRRRGGWTVKQAMRAGRPFYSMSEIGDYTFAPWKVVWREVAHTLDAAVAGPCDGKLAMPDHKLILIDCASEHEADYLCACLNTTPARLGVQAYIVLDPDPHILDHICIPRFDPGDPVHQKLSELSQEAHRLAAQGDEAALARVEAEIDWQAAHSGA